MTNDFDALSAYETLLEAGISDKEAKAQARLLAKAAKPEINLEMAFAGINKKFDLMSLEIKYLEKIGFGIGLAIAANLFIDLVKH